jgi:hypothetical protein
MTAKHTPGQMHIGLNPGPIVYSDKGAQIADCMSISNDHAENVANAQFIVKACNAHEDLISALQRIVGIEWSKGSLAWDSAIEQARAAIAKAEGKS